MGRTGPSGTGARYLCQGDSTGDLGSQWEMVCVSPVLVTPGTSCRADWGLPGGLKMLEGKAWGYALPPARGGGLGAQEAHPHPTQQEAHA